jgi:hypothetical protein
MTKNSHRARTVGVVLASIALLAVGSAGATGRYSDPSGDGGAGADITGVTVASDSSGVIAFSIAFAAASSNATALLALDTDANTATGTGGGAEYVFAVDQAENSYGFARWTGADWDFDTPSSTVRVRNLGNRIDIVVNRAELGNAATLNLSAVTFIEGDVGDTAPDKGVWSYSLATGGPDLQSIQVRPTPAKPKAGKLFAVAPTAIMLPPGVEPVAGAQPESYTCRATLREKSIAGSGAGGCTWKLPKNARGAVLRVVVTVSYQGASKSVPLTYRVA